MRLPISLLIVFITHATFAAGEDVVFGSSLSQKLVLDSVKTHIFGADQALDQLNKKQISIMDRTLVLHSEVINSNRTDLSMSKDINLILGSKSVGNWFIGGSGTATLHDLMMEAKILSPDFNVEMVNRINGDEKVPSLRVTLNAPLFRWVQKGEVKIKKHVLFFSWTETKHFKGVFKGFKWTGIYQLKKVTKIVNGNRRTAIVLDQEQSNLAIGSREFGGSGIPSAKFLKEYGDRIENNLAKTIGNALAGSFSLSSGEGETETRDILATRKLSDMIIRNSNLSLSMAVDVRPAAEFVSNPCGNELEAPIIINPSIPLGSLSGHDLDIRSLRNSVPLAFYQQMLYLRGRAGDFCGESSDGLGGSLTFSPIGRITVSAGVDRFIQLKLKMKVTHLNPLLPGGKLENLLNIERSARLIFETDATGFTRKIEFESTTNSVTGGSNPLYATALKTLLDRRPLHLAVPHANAFSGFVPKLRNADFVGQHLVIEYHMHTPFSTEPASPSPTLAKSVVLPAIAEDKDEIDPGVSNEVQVRWNNALGSMSMAESEIDLGSALSPLSAIQAGANFHDQDFDQLILDEDRSFIDAISYK
jgi:hypothetical protein